MFSAVFSGACSHTLCPVRFLICNIQELDKLISFSGTPTVVWRRTGEICLVAPEFCMLTEWSMEELTGRKKYIYEVRCYKWFNHGIDQSSHVSLDAALRKPVCCRILGKLCSTRVRKYDPVGIFALCTPQAVGCASACNVLFFNTERFI